MDRTFAAIVDAARQPVLYANWRVPDTPLGRYECVSLHMILFLHRTRDRGEAVEALAQDVLDEFFTDLDHSVRELGVGDAGVPKRMKKLGKMFYGRMGPYWEAIDGRDLTTLAESIDRNMAPSGLRGEVVDIDEVQLARYSLAMADHLATLSDEVILSGDLAFAGAQTVGAGDGEA
ncbi:MAG: ubiquinol-cytochrome C chaperone family protein [Pseudomonadota bacterium]